MINIGPSQRIASGGNDSRQTRASRYSHNSTTGRGIRMSKQQYDEMVAYYKYINSLVILSTPIEGSSLMVSSDGLYNTFQTYQDKFTTAGTYITLNGNTLSTSLSTTNAITNGSVNALILSPFTTALEGKQNTISVGSGISFANNVLSLLINNQVLAKSSNLVDSNGIYNMLNLKQPTLIPTADFSLVANSLSLATKDSVLTNNSTNLVTSGGIYNALLSKQDNVSVTDGLSILNTTNTNTITLRLVKDAIPTQNSTNLLDSNSIFTALSLKQDPINVLGGELLLTNNNLTLVVNDTIPSVNSPNLVPSSGIYSEFLKKQDNLQGSSGISLVGNTFSITKDNVPSSGSTNLIDSNGIYNALSTKQDNVTIVGNGLSLDGNNLSLVKDAIPIQNSGNLVDSHGLYTALTNKQYLLTIPETNLSLTGTTLSIVKDTVPTPGSVNLIDSSGIYGLITGKQNFLKVTENGGLSFSGNTIQFSLDSTPQQGSNKLVTSGGIYTEISSLYANISVGTGLSLDQSTNTLSAVAPYLYITLNPYLSGATNTTTSGTISVGMNSLFKAFTDDSTYSSHFEVYSIGSDSISYTNGNDFIEILKDGYYEIKCDLTVIKQTSAQLFSVGYSLLTVLSGNSTYKMTSANHLNIASGSSGNNKLSQSLYYIGYFSKDTQLKIVSANSSEQTLIADLDIVYDPNNTAERVVPFFSVERLG